MRDRAYDQPPQSVIALALLHAIASRGTIVNPAQAVRDSFQLADLYLAEAIRREDAEMAKRAELEKAADRARGAP